jgi:hypothetical protein
MLDADLAEMYGVEPKRLKEQVRRNIERFPEDFMFELTQEESEILSRSQIATLKRGQNIKYLPFAFTEHGVLMLSSVLRSEQAVQVNNPDYAGLLEDEGTPDDAQGYLGKAGTIGEKDG